MTQRVKARAVKYDDLSSFPGADMIDKEATPANCPLSDLHICVPSHETDKRKIMLNKTVIVCPS